MSGIGGMAPCPTTEGGKYPGIFYGGNTGVMVLEPRRLGNLSRVSEELKKFSTFDRTLLGPSPVQCCTCQAGEQVFAIRYMADIMSGQVSGSSGIQCLHRKYNCRRGFADRCCGGSDARIMHWSGTIKPWSFSREEVLATNLSKASKRPWETCNPPGTKLDRKTAMYGCCQTQKVGRGSSTIWHDWPDMSVDQQAMVVRWHRTLMEVENAYGELRQKAKPPDGEGKIDRESDR